MNSRSPHHKRKHHSKTKTPLISPNPHFSSSKSPHKLLTTFQHQISTFLTLNKELSNEISDLTNTIHNNESILESFIHSQNDIALITSLKSNIDEYLSLLECKSTLELQKYQLEHIEKELPNEVDVLRKENMQMKTDIMKRNEQIMKLERQLLKERKHALFKEPREEVYVVMPTQENIDDMNKIYLKGKEGRFKKKQVCLYEYVIRSLEEEVSRMAKEEERLNKVRERKGKRRSIEMQVREGIVKMKVNENVESCNCNNNNDNDISNKIKNVDMQLDNMRKMNMQYKNEIAKYKTTYHKLKEEINCLSQVIKRNSISTQDTPKKQND